MHQHWAPTIRANNQRQRTDSKRITAKKTIQLIKTLILINILTPQNPKIH
jgi:hypothetical protein